MQFFEINHATKQLGTNMSNPSDYDDRMAQGHRALKEGNYRLALSAFISASYSNDTNSRKASAFQMAGVTTRLLGDTARAQSYFYNAIHHARGDVELILRIQRDVAMNHADAGDLDMASSVVQATIKGFGALGLITEGEISRSFLGRVELLKGDKRKAVRLMRTADLNLCRCENRDYELNNLIWLMRIESPLKRMELVGRAMRLIRETGQTRRYKELLAIVVGGNWLYTVARKRFGSS